MKIMSWSTRYSARPWLIAVYCCLSLTACAQKDQPVQPRQSTDSRILDLASRDTRGGFARAIDGRTFHFPQDHAAHPRFKQERWRFNGHLQSEDGRQFAYQFTLQRLGLMNDVVTMLNLQGNTAKQSHWRSNHLYLARFTLSDIGTKKFYQYEKAERNNLGLADVTLKQDKPGAPQHLAMNVDNWTVTSSVTGVFPLNLAMEQQGVGIAIKLAPTRNVQSIGNRGILEMGGESGDANYNYTITRLNTSGRVHVGNRNIIVTGQSSFDHDWGTAPQGSGIKGINHFTLQLADGRDLAFYYLRDQQQNESDLSRGILILNNGKSENIQSEDAEIQATQQWSSPQTGIHYPVSWNINLPQYHLAVSVSPLVSNQEIHLGQTSWEGAVQVTGTQNSDTANPQAVTGYGYLQLIGYR